jgi:hypothetical protein
MNKRPWEAIVLGSFLSAGLVAGFYGLYAGNDAARCRLDFGEPDPVGQDIRIFIDAEDWQCALLKRMEARDRLVEALLADRLTLLQAAAGFRDLDQGSPEFNLGRFRQKASGQTDEERYCRLVILWAEAQHVDSPERAARVAARLGEELKAHLRDGTIHLPPAHAARGLLQEAATFARQRRSGDTTP